MVFQLLKNTYAWDAWVAQSVECLTLAQSWSHSLWVRAPRRALCWRLGACILLQIPYLPLSLPLLSSCSISQRWINVYKKEREKNTCAHYHKIYNRRNNWKTRRTLRIPSHQINLGLCFPVFPSRVFFPGCLIYVLFSNSKVIHRHLKKNYRYF